MAVALLILAACPHRFDPAAAPTATSPSADVTREVGRARELFEKGKLVEADAAFAALVQSHPDDPLAPVALLFRGRIAARLGKLERARELLAPLSRRGDQDQVGTRARYHLGLTLVRLGTQREGRQLLLPFLERVDDKERPALLAALAQATLGAGDAPGAARLLDRLHRVSTRPTEKLWARERLEALLPSLSEAQVRPLYSGAEPGSLLAALAGGRLADLESAAGNAGEARRILEATAGARRTHRVKQPAEGAAAVRASVIGLLVPLGGRYRAAGAELLRGAVEASGALQQGGAGRLALAIRDSNKDPTGAARELVIDERVLALVGTLDPGAGSAATRVAAAANVPFIALSRLPAPGSSVQLLPDSGHRAQALARHAAKLGLRHVMILAPENSYGQAMARAFTEQAGRLVVGRRGYRPGATSFAQVATELARVPRLDGVFVPDSSHTLSLIAPALAREGLWSGKAPDPDGTGQKKGRRSRALQLLATADGLGERLVKVAGRYVQGAVLAPGFFPDASGDGSGLLVRRFLQSQGTYPGLVAALGFDAVELVRVLRERGARTRAELQGALTRGSRPVQGMTGQIRLDEHGRRADPPLLYRVEGGQIRRLGL